MSQRRVVNNQHPNAIQRFTTPTANPVKTSSGKNKVAVKKKHAALKLGDSAVISLQENVVRYHKESDCNFSLKFENIDILGSSTPKQYNLMIKCDGYGKAGNAGTFVDLGASEYKFTNPTPYTLYLRVQRPLGFKEDPTSIGAWEPVGNAVVHKVKSNGTLHLHAANSATSHMQPRQVSVGTSKFLHLLSFSVYREPMSDSAAEPSKDNVANELGLNADIKCFYTCMGGDIGVEKAQWRVSRERLMDFTHAGPLDSIRIDALTVTISNGTILPVLGIQCAGGFADKVIYCKFIVDKKVVSTGFSYTTDGLDTKTVYALDHPSLANYWAAGTFWSEYTLGGFIKFDGTYWRMVQPTVGDNGVVTWNQVKGGTTGTYTSDYIGTQKLTPVLEQTVAIRHKRGGPIIAVKTTSLKHAHFRAICDVGDWWEQFVDGLVVVVKVVKLVGEIMGVLGLVAITDPRFGGVVSSNVLEQESSEEFLVVHQ